MEPHCEETPHFVSLPAIKPAAGMDGQWHGVR
jgi:hypothetical protein